MKRATASESQNSPSKEAQGDVPIGPARRPSTGDITHGLPAVAPHKGGFANALAVQVYKDLCQSLLSMNEFVYID
jgi:hypothetical protein